MRRAGYPLLDSQGRLDGHWQVVSIRAVSIRAGAVRRGDDARRRNAMRYMLLMVAAEAAEDDQAPAPESDEPCWMPWAREMQARGVVLGDGAQLRPASTATTVSVRDGEVLLSDGPFAETKEQIVGYDVIECANLDEAIEAASRHPVALGGGLVEVRPILTQ
jgi:hypothetical protein